MWESRTDTRIADFVMWSALAVYAAVWVAGLGFGLGGEWLLASLTAGAYVGMHIYEMARRGHCALSADSTACPVSLVLFSLAVLGMWAAGHPPLPGRSLLWAWGVYSVVLMGAHVAALAYSVSLGTALSFLFRTRIAAERTGITEAGAAHEHGGE